MSSDRTGRTVAAEHAFEYRVQADAYRRLAASEPVEQRRRLLMLSATKYAEAAEIEEHIASGVEPHDRFWQPSAPSA